MSAPDGFVIGDDWTVWNCRLCRQEHGVVWVDPVAGLWQQIVAGPRGPVDVVSTHRARRLAVNYDLGWVLIDPLNDTEMRAATWVDTIPMGALRGLVVREITSPRAAWFDRLFRRGSRG